MNAAAVLIEETMDTCDVCIAVMNFKADQQLDALPLVCPECHTDWPEWTVTR